MRKKVIFIVIASLLIGFQSFAQPIISGKIIDFEDQQPLIGAHIILESTGMGTVTDESGFFELTLEKDKDIVLLKYLGYEEKRIGINELNPDLGTIALHRSNTTLEEVIVSASPNFHKTNPCILRLAGSMKITRLL